MPARIEQVAPGQIERQRQAERTALAHLGHALADLLGGDQVEPAELVDLGHLLLHALLQLVDQFSQEGAPADGKTA